MITITTNKIDDATLVDVACTKTGYTSLPEHMRFAITQSKDDSLYRVESARAKEIGSDVTPAKQFAQYQAICHSYTGASTVQRVDAIVEPTLDAAIAALKTSLSATEALMLDIDEMEVSIAIDVNGGRISGGKMIDVISATRPGAAHIVLRDAQPTLFDDDVSLSLPQPHIDIFLPRTRQTISFHCTLTRDDEQAWTIFCETQGQIGPSMTLDFYDGDIEYDPVASNITLHARAADGVTKVPIFEPSGRV